MEIQSPTSLRELITPDHTKQTVRIEGIPLGFGESGYGWQQIRRRALDTGFAVEGSPDSGIITATLNGRPAAFAEQSISTLLRVAGRFQSRVATLTSE